jgi:hypothetical protein
MVVSRLGLGALLCAALAVPAWAQMPPPPGGPDLTCLCLKQSVDDHYTDMNAKNGELNAAQASSASSTASSPRRAPRRTSTTRNRSPNSGSFWAARRRVQAVDRRSDRRRPGRDRRATIRRSPITTTNAPDARCRHRRPARSCARCARPTAPCRGPRATPAVGQSPPNRRRARRGKSSCAARYGRRRLPARRAAAPCRRRNRGAAP